MITNVATLSRDWPPNIRRIELLNWKRDHSTYFWRYYFVWLRAFASKHKLILLELLSRTLFHKILFVFVRVLGCIVVVRENKKKYYYTIRAWIGKAVEFPIPCYTQFGCSTRCNVGIFTEFEMTDAMLKIKQHQTVNLWFNATVQVWRAYVLYAKPFILSSTQTSVEWKKRRRNINNNTEQKKAHTHTKLSRISSITNAC